MTSSTTTKETGMYMFDMNRRYNHSMGQLKLNMYNLVSHTNKRSVKDMIGVVVNRLVGMGLLYLLSL